MPKANPLYESAGFTTEQGGEKEASNPLYESTTHTRMATAGAIVDPLYEPTHSLTGVSGAQSAANPSYEPTPTDEEMREENYGASDDEDEGGAKF